MFRPGVEAVIGSRLEVGVPVVIEGDFLLPEWANTASFAGEPNDGRVRAVFVSEDDEAQLLANFLAREGDLQQQRAHASSAVDRWLRSECARVGVPTVAARPWATAVDRTLAAVAAMATEDARGEPDGVVITGVYGAGKSSLAAEIAETLERRGIAYGALDLDWLMWFAVPRLEQRAANQVYLANVAAVVANYRRAGVRHLVLAGAVRDEHDLAALRARRREWTCGWCGWRSVATRSCAACAPTRRVGGPTTCRSLSSGWRTRSASASTTSPSPTTDRSTGSPNASSTGSAGRRD